MHLHWYCSQQLCQQVADEDDGMQRKSLRGWSVLLSYLPLSYLPIQVLVMTMMNSLKPKTLLQHHHRDIVLHRMTQNIKGTMSKIVLPLIHGSPGKTDCGSLANVVGVAYTIRLAC